MGWQPVYLGSKGREAAAALVSQLPLRYPVDEARHYSDLGMILLGPCRRGGHWH